MNDAKRSDVEKRAFLQDAKHHQWIDKVLMPVRHDGKRPPNPWRYTCGYGHLHPSRKHAVACRRRRVARPYTGR